MFPGLDNIAEAVMTRLSGIGVICPDCWDLDTPVTPVSLRRFPAHCAENHPGSENTAQFQALLDSLGPLRGMMDAG